MKRLPLKMPFLLFKMILVLPLFGLEFGLMLDFHLELLSGKGFLVRFYNLFFLLHDHGDHGPL
jgi:hypothetical protein